MDYNGKSSQNLRVILGLESPGLSFDPLDSDSLLNAIHAEQLVGTLVRLTPNGRYEAYLAESWDILEEGRRWNFKLREGLTCEDGTPISSKAYKSNLETVIRQFAKHSNFPLVEDLSGYQSFKDGASDIPGISATSDIGLSFQFERPQSQTFLEYLGLPLLGFYCAANFNSEGRWKDKNKIISSTGYRLNNPVLTDKVELIRRSDWSYIDSAAPDKVIIERRFITQDDLKSENTIVLAFSKNMELDYSSVKEISLLPTGLHTVALSSRDGSPFSNKEVRQSFRDRISQKADKVGSLVNYIRSKTFYPHQTTKAPANSDASVAKPIKQSRPVQILTNDSKLEKTTNVIALISETLTEMGLDFELVRAPISKVDLMKYRDERNWDVKTISVDIGGGIENQLLRFMFCSKLGVSFPDPSQRICDLTNRYDQYGDHLNIEVLKKLVDEFDQIIHEEAAVIPLYKSGRSWLYSSNFESVPISPSTAVPFFEWVKIQ